MHPELLVRKRIWLMTLVLTGLFLLAAARIAVLTTSEAAALTERGIRQWTKAGIVTARRGTITDRKGRTLAISATAYIVTADPRLVSDTEKFLDSIEPVLNINKEAARKRLQDKTKGSIILKRQVSRETVDALRQLRSDAPEDSGLKALSFDEDICRYYPYGALLSQVLGLTTVDSEGQSGLESRYEDVLRGTEGSYLRQVDARNRQLDGTEGWYIPSQQGCGLVLTIDAEIQEMVEKAMRECIEVNQAQSVICLVSDVKTGAILAMCMNPCYDPNDPPRNDAETLTELMRLTAISDVYEPGSTFKILTAASALDSGVTTPQDSFYCSAKITVDGDTIRCWGRPHGAETMADGLKNSCNPVFVELALRMGTDTFYRYLTAFGLGKKTGIDLPGESPGILITSRNVKRVEPGAHRLRTVRRAHADSDDDGGELRHQRRKADETLHRQRNSNAGRGDAGALSPDGDGSANSPGNERHDAAAAGACRLRRRRQERGDCWIPHRRQNRHGTGLQEWTRRARHAHRVVLRLRAGE